jgi:ribosome biogenesis GTPase / thiamine phosphate phosphatase
MAIAGHKNVDCVLCINKADLDDDDRLYKIYHEAGFKVVRTSALTGAGIDELKTLLLGKISAFTGNSGVGKSSILNQLEPSFNIKTGEVSHKLGRGKHTTTHVELLKLSCGAIVADTPGFSSFDTERMDMVLKDQLQYAFKDFAEYIGNCKFAGCSHIKEKGCAVLKAVDEGKIQPTRYGSYLRLYEHAKEMKEWEIR